MLKLELIYDPAVNPPLQLHLPVGTNPNLIICLLSQVITGLSQGQVSGDASGLILPAMVLPKVVK